MAADPDWTDPCAVLVWLRPQYYKTLAGRQTVTVSHDGTSVTYSQASKEALAQVFRDLESQCAAIQGTTKRRRAIVAG